MWDLSAGGHVDSGETSIQAIHREFFVYKVNNIDLESLNLQKNEVSEVKWVDKEEIIARIKNNCDGITDKKTAWQNLLEYYKYQENTRTNSLETKGFER